MSMGERIRKLRAGIVVASAFGIAWGTIVTLALLLSILFTAGMEVIGTLSTDLLLLFGLFVAIGVGHGLVLSLAMAIVGRFRTFETFPRWLGAVIGGGIGALGWVVTLLVDTCCIPPIATAASTTALVGLLGAVSTTALLTVARRGALPPAPADSRQLGS
jgi:hypothetical protein